MLLQSQVGALEDVAFTPCIRYAVRTDGGVVFAHEPFEVCLWKARLVPLARSARSPSFALWGWVECAPPLLIWGI